MATTRLERSSELTGTVTAAVVRRERQGSGRADGLGLGPVRLVERDAERFEFGDESVDVVAEQGRVARADADLDRPRDQFVEAGVEQSQAIVGVGLDRLQPARRVDLRHERFHGARFG